MNTRQTVEIAALISAYSPHLIERPVRLPKAALEQFWECSQKRLKLWLSAMSYYQRRSPEVAPSERLRLWKELEPTLEEVFVTEVLTRVWGAILTAVDEELQSHQYEPIARNVLIGHLDARKRALQLLAADSTASLEHLNRLDQIRRRVERWTDLLLGHLVEHYQVQDFAFNAQRSREFGTQQLLQSSDKPREQAWTLVLVGLRMAFPPAAISEPPNELFQHQIVASMLNCFPSDSFQPEGPFRSILEGRVSRGGNRPEMQA
ncbi:MAG: hypothetical protein JWM11_7126, partial [Planctomycetaceae bacterium]|nr:hypothetical protein [Planctomycetaceae bacterium]